MDTATKELAENEKEQVTLQERYKGVDKKMKKLKKDVQEVRASLRLLIRP